jgi:glycosyltransferase involved in cell wall biosynthesis
MIKVALMSMKEIERRGQGIPKYILYLYKYEKLLEKTYDISVSKVYLPYNKLLGDALSFELNSFFKRPNLKSFDIIHIPTGFFILHNKPKNVKYVTTIHDTNPIIVKSKSLKYKIKDRLWRYLAFRRGLKFNINTADAIIVNSTQTRDEVLHLGTKKKVYVINLGIDKKFLIPKKFEKKRKNKKFYIGYVGSFATNKNVDFILNAANIINDESIEFHLWGAKTYNYNELIKKAGSNIKFMGFAPEKRIVEIYDSFDVFIFPSLYEGFGLPIIEAQARGLPVIIYKYGKIPKEVRKYCFEAEDPEHAAEIIENLKENGYNEEERKKAMKYARSFTWEKTARETLKVYNKVIK